VVQNISRRVIRKLRQLGYLEAGISLRGSYTVPPQPLRRGAPGVRPPRASARVYPPGEACPPAGALGLAGARAPEALAQKCV